MSQETLVSGKNNCVNKCVKGKKFREVLIMKFKTIIDPSLLYIELDKC